MTLIKAYTLVLLCFSTCMLAQKSSITLPTAGSTTYLSPIKWEGDLSQFNTPNKTVWDYRQLSPSFIQVEKFELLKNTRPNIISWSKMNGEQNTYRLSIEALYLMEEKYNVSFTKSNYITFTTKEQPPILKTTYKLGDTYVDKFTLESVFNVNALNGFEYLPNNVDSVKISILKEVTTHYKQKQKLQLFNFEQEALLVKKTTRSNLKIFVKYTNQNTWYDYNYKGTMLPDELRFIILNNKEIGYEYYVSDYIMPIFSYVITNDEVKDIKIQDAKNTYDVSSVSTTIKTLISFPNPTTSDLSISLINYPIDDYRLEIYNILGHKVKNYTLLKSQNNTIKINVSDLPKGIYLYKFVDGIGRKTTTQRFIKTSV